MEHIIEITHPDAAVCGRLLEIWEGAVRATHLFLSESDIQEIKLQVAPALADIPRLYVLLDAENRLTAFLGMDGAKVEMLFVDAAFRRQGFGKKLMTFAIEEMNAEYVDVNEQNPAAIAFYEQFGFTIKRRSSRDPQGRPFPILHMHLSRPS